MRIITVEDIKEKFLYKTITIMRWKINAILLSAIILGFIIGVYMAIMLNIPKIHATDQGSVTYNSQSQFNTGSSSNVQVTTSGISLAYNSPNNLKYDIPITINNTGNNNILTNYQIEITVNTATLISSGEMEANCGDIRFTQSDKVTYINNYWVENCNSTSTNIWIQVPSIPASSTETIYMFFGNSSLSTLSSVSNTFIDSIPSLAGMWNFNDGTGTTVTDSSGNGNNGSWFGTVSNQWTTGKYFTAGNFDGSDAVSVPASSTINMQGNITVGMWVNFASGFTGSDRFMTEKGGGSSDQMYFWWRPSGYLDAGYNTGSGYVDYLYQWTPVANTWYYLAWTANGTNVTIYINGVAVSTQAQNGTECNSPSSNLYIGSGNGGGYPFLGQIEDYSLWNSALTSTQIAEIYNNYAYTTTNYPNNALIRQFSSPEPSITAGSSTNTLYTTGTWVSPAINTIWNGGWGDGSTSTSTAFTATVANTSSSQTVDVKIRSSSSSSAISSATYYDIGTISSGTTLSVDRSTFTSLGIPANQYVQIELTLSQSDYATPSLSSFTIYYAQDNTPPETNASNISMQTQASGGLTVPASGWDNSSTPYFSWNAGYDSQSGLQGYCLYLGTSSSGNPATAKGLLGTSPITPQNGVCQFIISTNYIDLSNLSYQGSTWLTSSSSPYYLNISAIDNMDNVDTTPVSFKFYFDNTPPVNVTYISCPSYNFSNVSDMSFSWPSSGTDSSSDAISGVLGWQYQINSTSGTWKGTNTNPTLGVTYIPYTSSSYNLTDAQDGSSISPGQNIVYFRTVNNAGIASTSSTYRTCNIDYQGAAPVFPSGSNVTISPSVSTTNSFSVSWPAATATSGQSVAHYYYMINTPPPSLLSTLQDNPGTYIDNGTSTSIPTSSLANVGKGVNTIYVVAIDNSNPPNYSLSNDITGSFTLNSTNPDPVGNLIATDSSIKAQQKWNVTLTWTAPAYQGAGNLQYLIYRSSNDINFTNVGSTTGLSYVDNTPESALYYYYVVTEDGARAMSSNSLTVSITPTGRYTTPANLETGPTVSAISDNSATISWSTNRNSDSKIEYGTSSGNYYTTEPYVPTQVTAHVITLTNLQPSTTYYYKALWTDTDGNTGSSQESTFTTNPPPEVSNVSVNNVGLHSAYISFAISNAVQAQVQYGTTTSFGGNITVNTSPNESPYSVLLTNLASGTQYYYRIVMTDQSGNTYNSDTYNNLITLPQPTISNIQIDAIANSPEPGVLIQWNTNTAMSSVISYWNGNNSSNPTVIANTKLTTGKHQVAITPLNPKTVYSLIIKGDDAYGNQAVSDTQTFTTATDTVPPTISNLTIQSQIMSGTSGNKSQIIVSWTTDKPATSQVEFNQGSGGSYSQKSSEDSHYVLNHIVVISNLPTSTVFHLKAISTDESGNTGYSSDNITITPQATESALNLVLGNLEQVFGFLGNLNVSY